MSEKKRKRKKSADQLRDTMIPPPPLYDAQGVKRLSVSLGKAAKRLGLAGNYAKGIHDRLFLPLRLLTLLHRECEAVLRYDPVSTKRFLHRLNQLPTPGHKGDDILGNLRSLARQQFGFVKHRPRPQLVSFEAIATIYQAAFIASGGGHQGDESGLCPDRPAQPRGADN